jgi:hypothetical protein
VTPAVLVEVRCKVRGCGLLLDNVVSVPALGDKEKWTSYVRVHLCPKHGEGAGYGNVRAWQGRQRRAGKPADRALTFQWIQWAELRPAVERALARGGRTQVHVV